MFQRNPKFLNGGPLGIFKQKNSPQIEVNASKCKQNNAKTSMPLSINSEPELDGRHENARSENFNDDAFDISDSELRTDSIFDRKDPNFDSFKATKTDTVSRNDSEKQVEESHSHEMVVIYPTEDENTQTKKPRNSSIQETNVVKARLGFEEHEYIERAQKSKIAINNKIKASIEKLYDCVDAFVNDITRTLHKEQQIFNESSEEKLRDIRSIAMQADMIENSMSSFVDGVKQAYTQAFAVKNKESK